MTPLLSVILAEVAQWQLYGVLAVGMVIRFNDLLKETEGDGFILDTHSLGYFVTGECLSRLLPRFRWLPMAPDGFRWLPTTSNTRSCWLPMAPNGWHHVSLLPNHYPQP